MRLEELRAIKQAFVDRRVLSEQETSFIHGLLNREIALLEKADREAYIKSRVEKEKKRNG